MRIKIRNCVKMKSNSVIQQLVLSVITITIWIQSTNTADVVEGSHEGNDDTIFHLDAANMFGAPLIIPTSSEITYELDRRHELRCEADHPITWLHDDPMQLSNFHLFSTVTEDVKRPYVSVLTFTKISHYDVGHYYCIKNQSVSEEINYEEEVEQFTAARIYVFVNDLDNPIMETHETLIHGTQYSNIVIPCRPTSKTVELELVKDDDEQRKLNFEYEPTIGFTIQLSAIHDSGYYTCRVKGFDDLSQNFEVLVSEHYSLVQARTEYIEKPTIAAINGALTHIGKTIQLSCSVDVQTGLMFTLEWLLPNKATAKNDTHTSISISTRKHNVLKPGLDIGTRNLTVYNAQSTDHGPYKCLVQDHLGHTSSNIKFIAVLPEGQTLLSIYEESGKYESVVALGKTVQFVATYKAAPDAIFEWYDPKGEVITEANDKFVLKTTEHQLYLKIPNVDMKDAGKYKLVGDNGIDKKEVLFDLKVKDKPTVHIGNVTVQVGDEAHLVCEAVGYPLPTIMWSFKACRLSPEWPSCGPQTDQVIDNIPDIKKLSEFKQIANIKITPDQAGIVTCKAKNSEGKDSSSGEVRLTDLTAPLMVWGVDLNRDIVVNDTVTLTCGASAYIYPDNLVWYRDDERLANDHPRVHLSSSQTDYSYRRQLTITQIEDTDSGIYDCRVGDAKSDRDILIDVKHPKAPHIMETNLDGNVLEIGLGEPVRLICDVKGVPHPTIEWFKDNESVTYDADKKRVVQVDDGRYLDISTLRPGDEGKYKCTATNQAGQISVEANLKIGDMFTPNYALIATISTLVLLLFLGLILYLCLRIRRNKKYLNELKAAGLENFEQGNPDSINPELNLDEQADLLPYDKNFEFPREKLKLGKQLGCGAFGVVVKGLAEGIIPYEDQTVVAVKMVKKQTDNEVMRALISELKIMVHLGHHLNVVNLLGAVTKNIVKREVMVIVEYCRFGNVQNFLLKHRPYYVDQIIKETDDIDPEILNNEFRWSKHSAYEYNSQGLKYLKLDFPPKIHKLNNNYENGRSSGGVDNAGAHINSQNYVRHSGMQTNNGVDSCGTEATLISYGPDSANQQNSVNSVDEQAWCSNYRSDYKGPARPVTTSDLVCWAFQVARGMEYLSSRKVLHGDLAARNILLCDDNVVKICDFGLAKSMYKTNNYKKKSESPLPFKWLALESISDSVFSTYSDIWAFGIVMWEFFSLGKVPYPGMNADESLYFKLKDGYRMEKPQYSTQNLYDIMLSCWRINPETRPGFKTLEKMLGGMLSDSVKEHYLDLNDPYLKMNTDQFQEGATDYLAMLGPPDQIAPAPPTAPTYVNGNLQLIRELNERENQPDYLKMSPRSGSVRYNAGSSKSTTRESSSNFGYPAADNSPTLQNNLNSSDPKARTKKAGLPEERPMLSGVKDSDSDSEGSPQLKKSSPLSKSIFSELDPMDESYVNVAPSVFAVSKDAFSNPSYVSVKTVNEKV